MQQTQTIKKSIFLPLSISLILLLITILITFLIIYSQNHSQLFKNLATQTTQLFEDHLLQDHEMLDIALKSLADNTKLQSVWLDRSRDNILNLVTPAYHHWNEEHKITHLYFINPNRICFLRIHQPQRHGDLINRYTLRAAEQDKSKVTYGIELGPLGTFTLRVVMPWFIKDQFVGYLEAGEEIEHITNKLATALEVDFAVAIKKKYLARDAWIDGMKMMSRAHDWDQFPDYVITSTTAGLNQPFFASYFDRIINAKHKSGLELKDKQAKQSYKLGCIPLIDFGNRHVGDLIIQQNITVAKHNFSKTILISILLFSLIGTLLVFGFNIQLNKLGRKLETMQSHLQNQVSKRLTIAESMKSIYQKTSQILTSIPSILIGINHEGKITEWNSAAEQAFNLTKSQTINQPFETLPIPWNSQFNNLTAEEKLGSQEHIIFPNVEYTTTDGKKGILNVTLSRIKGSGTRYSEYLLIASDISEQKVLETQLLHAQKLESIGQLSAGIAHEINTPIQYIGDNIHFLDESFVELKQLISEFGKCYGAFREKALSDQMLENLDQLMENTDLTYLMEEIPEAVKQSLEGVERVATIVQALKGFAHPDDSGEMKKADINQAITNTVMVARNEWKYVADLKTVYDPSLPLVDCYLGEFNQVILNLIVNAAHSIADIIDPASGKKGTIIIQTDYHHPHARISIRDSGKGIPPEIQDKIFNPFFTTKEVGKGTGQGLAIAHSVITDKHGGSITFESVPGDGTTFYINLPITTDKEEAQHA